MNVPGSNPKNPILTAFLSYSFEDRDEIMPLIRAFQAANVEVQAFSETEPTGVGFKEWIAENISCADCIILIVSDNSLARPNWVEREVGLAKQLLAVDGVLHHAIVPILLKGKDALYEVVRFQPRSFDAEEPIGEQIVWSRINCMMVDRDGIDATVRNFMHRMTPSTTIIKDPSSGDQEDLFNSAMRLYKKLLPDERERDQEVHIERWICQSWIGENLDDKSRWINVLAVHHILGKVIGLFWCNVDRNTGIGFVAFWGLLAAHRAHGRGIAFAQEVIGQLCTFEQSIRALLFATERVDWASLDLFLNSALKVKIKRSGKTPKAGDWYRKLSEPFNDRPSAIIQAFDSLSEKKKKSVIEQLRRFRRFALFSSGGSYNSKFERQGVKLLAYTCKSAVPYRHGLAQKVMADFVQPPIRPPIESASDCYLWLFAMIFHDQLLSPKEAVDWVYDVYLKSSFGEGPTELEGWNEYMVAFKEKWKEPFIGEALLRPLELREWYAPYNAVLTEMKRYWVQRQAAGTCDDQWNMQL